MFRLLQGWLTDARSSPNLHHVDTCDGIRAAAILIVGWFHIWQQSWLAPYLNIGGQFISFDPLVRSGYIWVDMMILVSGFCMYLPIAREGSMGVPDVPDFYAKRLARIHPSYLLTILVMTGVALATVGMSERLLKDIAAHLTYTHTFFYDTYYASNMGGALWTLAIEMEFYLIFPLIAREFRKSPGATFIAMVATSVAFRFWIEMNYEDVSMLFNQLPAYLDTFAFGMLAAELLVRMRNWKRGVLSRIICSLLCVVICLALWNVARRQASNPNTQSIRIGQMHTRMWMNVLGAALMLASANAGWIMRRVFSNPLTRFVSAVSMQFYIWHQTLAVWMLQYRIVPSEYEYPNYDGDHHWQLVFTALCFLVPLLLGAVLTYGFERPVAAALLARWRSARQKRKGETK